MSGSFLKHGDGGDDFPFRRLKIFEYWTPENMLPYFLHKFMRNSNPSEYFLQKDKRKSFMFFL